MLYLFELVIDIASFKLDLGAPFQGFLYAPFGNESYSI